MNSEDQGYDQGGDVPQEGGNDQQDQNQDRYSQKNHSHHNGNQYRNRRRGGHTGNKIKQNIRNRIDPRAKFSREGIKQQIRDFRRDFVKNTGKQVIKKAAMSPWTWLVIGAIALIIFLVIIITGAEEEENCGGSGASGPTVTLGISGPDKAEKGDKLEYTLTVSGSTAAVTIKNPIPKGTKFVSADNDGKNEQNIVTWKLPGDGEVKLTLEATEDKTHVVNIASVDEDGGGEVGVEAGGGKAGDIPDESGDDYKKVQFRGATFNNRTKRMLEAAEKDFGEQFRILQGSYSTGVAASAGVHDGGGAADIGTNGWDKSKIDKAVTALRKNNFAAWYRTPAQGFTPHIHAIAIGDKELAPGAKQQVEDYKNGKNGLASGGKDDGPKTDVDTGGCDGGAANEGFTKATKDNCGGKYDFTDKHRDKNPLGNYGDPSCNFSKEKVAALIKEKDAKHLHEWYDMIIKRETGGTYDPNVFAEPAGQQAALDAGGAWGLYQMGSSNPAGQDPSAKGKNGQYDRGDVNWEVQTTNAINHNTKVLKCNFKYWRSQIEGEIKSDSC